MDDPNISATLENDGVLVARIDMPGRAMNVFSMSMMDSLERLLDHVDATPAVKGVVITSGKPACFIAGADLEMVRSFTEQARTASHEALHVMCGRLGRLFCRLEKSDKPYVAAINGLALGGGLEVTLACHERVVADDHRVQLGLPEIKLGLLPGAGGTQRLPRLIDPLKAMRMLLQGDSVSPAEALDIGLVNEVTPSGGLIERACARARALRNPRAPWNVPGKTFSSAPFDFNREDAVARIKALIGVSEYQFARYPAYAAIMKCVIGGWNRQIEEASHWEMDCFIELIRNPIAGNMVTTMFLNRQRAAKEDMTSYTALLPRLEAARDAAKTRGCTEDDVVFAVALAAARAWELGGVGDPALADVATVTAGVAPSWTGGPFRQLGQMTANDVRERAMRLSDADRALFALPERIDALLRALREA